MHVVIITLRARVGAYKKEGEEGLLQIPFRSLFYILVSLRKTLIFLLSVVLDQTTISREFIYVHKIEFSI